MSHTSPERRSSGTADVSANGAKSNSESPANVHSVGAPRLSLLEAILNNAIDAIVTIDPHGLVVSANASTERLFGYSEAELIGQNVNLLMPPPYHDEHDAYLQNYLKTGVRKVIGLGREVEGRRRDGTVFHVHLAVSEMKVEQRTLFVGIVRDISDLKAAERKLELANEELEQRVKDRTAELREAQSELLRREKLATLGQVAGGIAHEIRNPLNAMKTSAYYLLNAKNASPSKVQEHLTRIDRQVNQIANVVTALSDVARMPEPQRQPIDLSSCIRDVIASISLPGNIDVVHQIPSGLPPAWADPYQLPIVFRNLIRNARDAMPNGGCLTVRITNQQLHLHATIEDDGIGIPAVDIERIMEPLYSTKARGMGLGLAISRTIVEKNHGVLTVRSEVGRGSQFTVRLDAHEGSGVSRRCGPTGTGPTGTGPTGTGPTGTGPTGTGPTGTGPQVTPD